MSLLYLLTHLVWEWVDGGTAELSSILLELLLDPGAAPARMKDLPIPLEEEGSSLIGGPPLPTLSSIWCLIRVT